MTTSDATAKFAMLAREYCNWCEGEKPADPEQARADAIRHLAGLYVGALGLPRVERNDYPASDAQVSQADWESVYRSCSALPVGYYYCALDPSIDAQFEMGAGDVGDDIADIYRDMKEGLQIWDSGQRDDAAWHWIWTCRLHWGVHALEALRALHLNRVSKRREDTP